VTRRLSACQLNRRRRTAQRFMAIARDLRLRKAMTSSLLPPYWNTLYKITRLGDENGVEAAKRRHLPF
jgi:hypothetical protein